MCLTPMTRADVSIDEAATKASDIVSDELLEDFVGSPIRVYRKAIRMSLVQQSWKDGTQGHTHTSAVVNTSCSSDSRC